jgi:hypothetical protein
MSSIQPFQFLQANQVQAAPRRALTIGPFLAAVGVAVAVAAATVEEVAVASAMLKKAGNLVPGLTPRTIPFWQ